MSEKIYACLLRLYPSRFREMHGDEALQLFCDRLRDEAGFFPRLRLWFDVLADLLVSVPREHRRRPAMAVAASAPGVAGLPSFQVLEGESLRPGALVFGSLLSVAAFGVCLFLINHARTHRPLTPPWSLFQNSASRFVADDTQRPVKQSTPLEAVAELNAAERNRVIAAVAANLKEHYFDADTARKMADRVLEHERSGDYEAVTDGTAFADLLTHGIRDVSHDLHLVVVYSKDAISDQPAGSTPDRLTRYREAMRQENCTFEKVAILPHNIGYLKLNSFPDPSVCESTARAAMASLNRADAVIFDLRDNTGGYPEMVMLIAAYLFDHPEYMYNPRENTTEHSWTRPVAGSRLADKPVYVLTSARTYSGAEHFSYDLKMLKRATIVGETTGGATHSGTFYRIDQHFGMGIPETRAINPFSTADWAVTGVEPDVRVKAADALETARKMVESGSQSRPLSAR